MNVDRQAVIEIANGVQRRYPFGFQRAQQRATVWLTRNAHAGQVESQASQIGAVHVDNDVLAPIRRQCVKPGAEMRKGAEHIADALAP